MNHPDTYWLLTTEYLQQSGGGIGTYAHQWAVTLQRNNINVTVFLLNKEAGVCRETISNNIRLIEFSPDAWASEAETFLGYETKVSLSFEKIVSRFIQNEGRPDCLEAQDYQGVAYFLLLKKHLGYEHLRDLQITITCHCPHFLSLEFNQIPQYQLPYFWIGEMERFCINAADLVVSPSQYLIDTLRKRFPNLTRQINVIRNPFGLTGKKNNTLSPGIDAGDALVIGKLSPIKGIPDIIEVFVELWENGYTGKLRLAGDPYYYHHPSGRFMKAVVEEKFKDYVKSGLLEIMGMLVPSALDNEIGRAGFIIIPSKFDNFPYTAIEVMAAGKVVVVSDSGGQNEIIEDGETGFIFSWNSREKIAALIDKVAALPLEKKEMIGKAAMNAVNNLCAPNKIFNERMQALVNSQENIPQDQFPYTGSLKTRRFEEIVPEKSLEPLLSVVIPYYNMQDYVEEAVQSIRKSTYRNIEIIIVDDGSKLTPENPLLKYNEIDRIRIFRQKNKGLAAARNKGVELARGSFIAFLDADDTVEPSYYQKAIDIMTSKRNVHFVGCWSRYFGNSQAVWPAFTPEPPYILYHNMVNSSALVFSATCLKDHRLNDETFIYGMEDYDAVLSLIEKGYYGIAIPECLFNYRVRSNSMARSFNRSNMLYTYQLLANKHFELYRKYATEVAGLITANGPGFFIDNPTLDYHLTAGLPRGLRMFRKMGSRLMKNKFFRKTAIQIIRRVKK
ncbi:MAG: glycosyltransferase [Chitinophagaceae bacterium]|nr:glycosyltransferase [Chitinophagaceae bacterium]